MTREEAIKIIDCYDLDFYDLSGEKIPADKLADAFDMAIEALRTEVVRCKDCKHSRIEGDTTKYMWCGYWNKPTDHTRYCSGGKRIDE